MLKPANPGVKAIKAAVGNIYHSQGHWSALDAMRVLAAGLGDRAIDGDEAFELDKYDAGFFTPGADELYNAVLNAEEGNALIERADLKAALADLDRHRDGAAVRMLLDSKFEPIMVGQEGLVRSWLAGHGTGGGGSTTTCEDLADCGGGYHHHHHHHDHYHHHHGGDRYVSL
jgi:hypothetical protein